MDQTERLRVAIQAKGVSNKMLEEELEAYNKYLNEFFSRDRIPTQEELTHYLVRFTLFQMTVNVDLMAAQNVADIVLKLSSDTQLELAKSIKEIRDGMFAYQSRSNDNIGYT